MAAPTMITLSQWRALYPLYSMGIKTLGDYEEAIFYIEEQLTFQQLEFLQGFSAWIKAGPKKEYIPGHFVEARSFGSGNYVQRYKAYRRYVRKLA
jgi:hypothetical protein